MQEDFIKATHGAYKVLNLLPDGDPLKNKAKEKVLAILENLTLVTDSDGWLSLKKYLSSDREKMLDQIIEDITVLESYLQIAKHQGWIGGLNVVILVKEYGKIKDGLLHQKKSQGVNVKLPEIVSKPEAQIMNNEPMVLQESIAEVQENSSKASVRQAKILQILAQKGKAQVSDIIRELPRVTKRTIRRDFDELLKAGKVERTGEWNQVFYKIFNRT